ncbi:peptidoglycan DD-metalloendopeptidase family protein [Lutibacter sp. TH_r2]|uniref:peptidoglycan DD-metalloendopeptidase family protein n=1 Tax=Lutibacter sp. TH_r2 TaxID=3082083 RepID=UPI0029530831|nr:peptidoglycan DD-metalloendopeptidase family protein [Lutibacter sp. TH_r2]MDV7186782.1 peptidoglycan DD-metalloendopeptidase family protein [Lutibacter sp. TH_r2]
MKKLTAILLLLLIIGCKEDKKPPIVKIEKPKEFFEFGYKLNDYKVINDTIQPGENFSEILDRNHIEYPKVLEIVNEIKDTFNVRRIKSGIPYTILAKKDSTEQAQVFIYQHSKVRYTVVDFKDSIISAYNAKKPVTKVIKTASGVITSSLSQAIDDQGLSYYLAFEMSDIYAWTIDFFRLQKNDKFKLIYEQLYINDTIPVGIGKIKAAYFEHGDKPFYAFRYVPDSTLQIPEYFDDETNNLRRQFLKAPVKFSRISSRYNLRRRIAFYGNRIRPHKGTDFAAPVGTPIMSTANGTIIESRYKGGNGNYVKVRHNGTYSTQYLHMSKRAVKVGDVVKQGDVIGYIGMTGNTSGPHVCYRFWKNGKQVDPLKQKLPAAEPMKEEIKSDYLKFIEPLKSTLDSITYPIIENSITTTEEELNT